MEWAMDPRFISFCEEDAAALLAEAMRLLGLEATPSPATVLDVVLTDVLRVGLQYAALPHDIYGGCDYQKRRVLVNARLPQIVVPNTKIEGVFNSTKAHELGHLRLPGHAPPDLERFDLPIPPIFERPFPWATQPLRDCGADRGASLADENGHEFEAYIYGRLFLIPYDQLIAREEALVIRNSVLAEEQLESDRLWDLVFRLCDHFEVTGAMMVRRLKGLGWIDRHEKGLVILSDRSHAFLHSMN